MILHNKNIDETFFVIKTRKDYEKGRCGKDVLCGHSDKKTIRKIKSN